MWNELQHRSIVPMVVIEPWCIGRRQNVYTPPWMLELEGWSPRRSVPGRV